jgi:hypothetical protein
MAARSCINRNKSALHKSLATAKPWLAVSSSRAQWFRACIEWSYPSSGPPWRDPDDTSHWRGHIKGRTYRQYWHRARTARRRRSRTNEQIQPNAELKLQAKALPLLVIGARFPARFCSEHSCPQLSPPFKSRDSPSHDLRDRDSEPASRNLDRLAAAKSACDSRTMRSIIPARPCPS